VQVARNREMGTTDKRFRDALRDLILAEGENVTLNGNVDYPRFVERLGGVSYETLRKALAGERKPSASLMEAVASALGISPEYFVEYRLANALRSFDVGEVGWDEAVKNLHEWAQVHTNNARKRSAS
jgi:transcriptional regulator with XRE-family HTH domain